MKYEINDKYVVNGELAEVRFLNETYAWLAYADTPHILEIRVDMKGRTQDGIKIKPVYNRECLAV